MLPPKMSIVFAFLMCLPFVFAQIASIHDHEPNGIHVLHGADPTSEVNILWWTKLPVNTAIVYYSLVDSDNDFTPSDSLACNHNKLAKGVLARTPVDGKYVQRVLISGLLPNRRYCYEITSGKASSNIYTFRTSSRSINLGIKDNPNRTTISHESHANFIVYSSYLSTKYVASNEIEAADGHVDWETYDSEQPATKEGTNQTKLASAVHGQRELADLFLNSFKSELNFRKIYGILDLVSPNLRPYDRAKDRLQQVNDAEIDMIDAYADAFANIPILPTVSKLDDTRYKNAFKSQFPINGQQTESFFYSVDVDGVHVITYSTFFFKSLFMTNHNRSYRLNDTNSTDSPDEPVLFDPNLIEIQLNWLKKDLTQANNNRHWVPWIIVMEPEKIDYQCRRVQLCADKLESFNLKLESLFSEFDVDLILETNNYVYKRSFPSMKHLGKYKTSYANTTMPVRISLPTHKLKSKFKFKSQRILAPESAFEYEPTSSNTFGILEVVNSTHLYWIYVLTNETLIDEFTLIKDHNGAFDRVTIEHLKLIEHLNRTNADESLSSTDIKRRNSAGRFLRLKYVLSAILFIGFLLTIFYFLRNYNNQPRSLGVNTYDGPSTNSDTNHLHNVQILDSTNDNSESSSKVAYFKDFFFINKFKTFFNQYSSSSDRNHNSSSQYTSNNKYLSNYMNLIENDFDV